MITFYSNILLYTYKLKLTHIQCVAFHVADCIAAAMVHQDVSATQVPQINDGSDTILFPYQYNHNFTKSKDKSHYAADCISLAARMVQEDALTTEISQSNDGSDTVWLKFFIYDKFYIVDNSLNLKAHATDNVCLVSWG